MIERQLVGLLLTMPAPERASVKPSVGAARGGAFPHLSPSGEGRDSHPVSQSLVWFLQRTGDQLVATEKIEGEADL